METSRVIFQKSKSFWKTKNSVELVIVEHANFRTFEVAAFETALQLESPRVYLNARKLHAILCSSSAPEWNGKDELRLYPTARDVVCTYVFNRIYIRTLLPMSHHFEIEIGSLHCAGYDDELDGLIISRPLNLAPHFVSFVTESKYRVSLSPRRSYWRDLWRIPLILLRISKGYILPSRDIAIWKRFSEGITPHHFIQSMRKVLAKDISPESWAVLVSAAHAVVVPQNGPVPHPRLRAPSSNSLPEGFAEAIIAGDPARDAHVNRPNDHAESLSSLPPAKAGLPPLTRSGGPLPHRKSRTVFYRDSFQGDDLKGFSAPVSASSSKHTSPAGSRAASPSPLERLASAFGYRSLSPSPSIEAARSGEGAGAATESPVGGESPERVTLFRSRQGGSGTQLFIPPPEDRGSIKNCAPCLTTATIDEDEDDEVLLGDSISSPTYKARVSRIKSQSPGVADEKKSRLHVLRQRRSTFDSPIVTLKPSTSSTAGHIRSCSGGGDGNRTAGHVRGSSGGGIAALLGLTSTTNRVVPTNDDADFSIDLDLQH